MTYLRALLWLPDCWVETIVVPHCRAPALEAPARPSSRVSEVVCLSRARTSGAIRDAASAPALRPKSRPVGITASQHPLPPSHLGSLFFKVSQRIAVVLKSTPVINTQIQPYAAAMHMVGILSTVTFAWPQKAYQAGTCECQLQHSLERVDLLLEHKGLQLGVKLQNSREGYTMSRVKDNSITSSLGRSMEQKIAKRT